MTNNTQDQITLIEIRERLVRIETILEEQDYKAVQKTADDALDMATRNNQHVEELRGYVKWFVMAVLGSLITAVMALVLK